MYSMDPQAAVAMNVVMRLPGFHVGSENFRSLRTLPSRSPIWYRATRVPLSTVVRMNRASNMMAKWYQNAIESSPPMYDLRKLAMPMAKVVAPPVRETMLSSPTSCAAWVNASAPSYVVPWDCTSPSSGCLRCP